MTALQTTLASPAASGNTGYDIALSELQHRLRNDFQKIVGLAELEMRRCEDIQARAGLERIAKRVFAMAALYGHLRVGDAITVNFTEYLTGLCERLIETVDTDRCQIRFVVDLKPLQLDLDRAAHLAVAVNELVANAAKHAFPDGTPGVITVRLQQSEPGRVALIVSDNGLGFTDLRPAGEGLAIVQKIVDGVRGALSRANGSGTTWTITFRSNNGSPDRTPSGAQGARLGNGA